MALLRAVIFALLATGMVCAQERVAQASGTAAQAPSSPTDKSSAESTAPPSAPAQTGSSSGRRLPSSQAGKSSKKTDKAQAGTKSEANDPAAAWYERAQRLTNELLDDDRWRLHMLGEALPARLADAWWKVDQPRARRWLNESVYAVTFSYQNEKPEAREERLNAAGVVFEVANKYDRDAARKIEAMMMDMAEQDLAAGNRKTAGNVRNVLSRNIRMSDRETSTITSAEMGEDLLRLGDQNLQMSLGKVARTDPQAANRLFNEALAKAATGGDNYNVFFGLAEYAWPTLGGATSDAPVSDDSKTALLDALAGSLLRPAQSDKDREQVCRTVARTANRVLDKFPAAQAGMVQTAISNCNAQFGDDKRDVPCSSVDECLKAADLETDAGERAELKMQAAFMASNEQDPIRALDIYDSLSKNERDAAPDWSSQRTHLVTMALDELYKRHDTVRIQRILDDTPEEQHAETILNFGLMVTMSGDKPYGQLMFSQARAALEKSPVQNPYVYKQLLAAYAQYMPEDSLQAFTLVVNGLNQIKYIDPKDAKDRQSYFLPLGSRLEVERVPTALLEKDDAFVFASLKSLDDPRARAAFRLGCLQVALHKYQELKNTKAKAPAESQRVKD